MEFDLLFNYLISSFINRIFLMILVRIKGYNRHILSIPGNQRYHGMEMHQTFQKRINKPLLRSRAIFLSLDNTKISFAVISWK